MRIHRISLDQLRQIAPQRPPGYADDFLSGGRIEDGVLLLDDNVYRRLWEKYTEPPSLATKASNALRAIGRVTKAATKGQRVPVSNSEQARRMAICQGCEFFTGKTCSKCGCIAIFKTKLATEKCPIGKW